MLWAAVEACQPDVVVTDVELPPARTDEGVRFAVELRRRRPEIAVVVLGGEPDLEHATTLLGGGASGRAYLLKDRVADGAVLAQTIRTVSGGGSHVDIRVVEKLLAAPAPRSATPRNLTPRDAEILSLMAEGMRNAAIARELSSVEVFIVM